MGTSFTRKEYDDGFKQRNHHKNTYNWLRDHIKKGNMPKYEEFILHMVYEDLIENSKSKSLKPEAFEEAPEE